ncbi:jg23231 [Pararge aegeria aegeria]|uniref:CCT-eta n=1 Tax=Pararge aegeria aegeria TaxID=348720 RepID=A0A8S4RI06_9NEOP|nr:jg23231 [Pararge aegeria aegeria]
MLLCLKVETCARPYIQCVNIRGIKKVTGGGLEDSFLVAGVAFKKTFSYAGFEMQPKSYDNCKIALLNIELELKAERDNAEVRVDNVKEYQKVVDAEWQILYDKLALLHASGANVVLSKLPIGDVATQYFADRDMFCAGRVTEEDLRRTQRACGGAVLSSVRDMKPDALGHCAEFSERQVGGERYNIFTGCPAAKTCTLILRGGSEQFLEETERSLHDAIMIVRRTIKNDAVVAGGGAIDMELSKHLRDHSKTIAGKEQLLIAAVARAFESIPRQLCDNAGFDATNLLNKLRQKHHQGTFRPPMVQLRCWSKHFARKPLSETTLGNNSTRLNIPHGGDLVSKVQDDISVYYYFRIFFDLVVEASVAIYQILSIDETIKNVKGGGDMAPPPGRGMGRPRMG